MSASKARPTASNSPAPELALHYGGTPSQERRAKPGFRGDLAALPGAGPERGGSCGLRPQQDSIGAGRAWRNWPPRPRLAGNLGAPERYGKYGEIMPEDEFLGFMDICDVFDLIWLDKDFAARIKEKLAQDPVVGESQLAPPGKPGTRPLKSPKPWKSTWPCRCIWTAGWWVAAAGPMIRTKTSRPNVVALRSGLQGQRRAGPVAFDQKQRARALEIDLWWNAPRGRGRRYAARRRQRWAVAEIAGCGNASGFDVRGFCAGPAAAVIAGAGMVASGVRRNVAVLGGGSPPKLYMNSRDHVVRAQSPGKLHRQLAVPFSLTTAREPVIRLIPWASIPWSPGRPAGHHLGPDL